MSLLFGTLLDVAYLATILLLSPWIVWTAWRTGKYRDGWGAKLLGSTPRRSGSAPAIWLHAVSVGEVNLLATTIKELRRRWPGHELIISTTTNTGYALAVKKYGAECLVTYAPLDFTWAVRRAIARLRPTLLVLAELEVWPNLIFAAKRAGVPIVVMNGRLGERSFRGYRRIAPLARYVFGQLDLVAAQDAATAQRFRQLGAPRVVVTGSLKYDGAETDRTNPRTQLLVEWAAFNSDDVVWLVGSTQAPEEAESLEIYRRLVVAHPRLKLVIVPRHKERFDEVASLLARSGVAWRRRSDPSATPAPVVLVDTIGELGAWWGLADIGLVGGSYGDRGGQNMIEPAAYGVATTFGPNTWNFRDIVAALLAADGAVVSPDFAALEAFVQKCLADPAYADALGERARAFVATQLGATARTADLIATSLPRASTSHDHAA